MSVNAFRFTESAEADLDSILSYTMSTWGEDQAEAYIAGLYQLLDVVSARPAIGRLRPDLAPELRGFPYREHLIFYTVFDDEIVVIRILASRQNIETDIFKS